MSNQQKQERLWVTWAIVLWAVVFTLSLGRVALYQSPKHAGIYPLFEQTGQAWAAGQPIYSPEPGLSVYRYSPIFAAMLAPLSMLPGPVGSFLMRLLSLGTFLYGLIRWGRSVPPVKLNRAGLAAMLVFALPLSYNAMVAGQTTGLAVGLLLLGTAAYAEDKPTQSVIWLTLSALIKAYPIALLLILISLFPRKLAWRSLLVLAVALLLPFVLQNPRYVWNQYGDWFRFGLNARDGIDGGKLLDIRAALRFLHVDLDARAYLLLEIVTGTIVALVTWIASFRGVNRSTLLVVAFGLGTCWMTVFGPATESQTYIFIAPIVAWFFLAACLGQLEKPLAVAVTLSFALTALTQFNVTFSFHRAFSVWGPHAIGGLVLMLCLAILPARQLRITTAALTS